MGFYILFLTFKVVRVIFDTGSERQHGKIYEALSNLYLDISISHLVQDVNVHIVQDCRLLFVHIVQDCEVYILNEEFNATKYKNEFNKNKYDSLRIVVPKGTKSKLQSYCKSQEISLNKLINNYINSLPLDDSNNITDCD